MENKDYIVDALRRYLTFPLHVCKVGARPHNDDHLQKQLIRYVFICFLWNRKPVDPNLKGCDGPFWTSPRLGIALPGQIVTHDIATIRDELFFMCSEDVSVVEQFRLKSCYFRISPRMQRLREELAIALEHRYQPGMADRIDFLAIDMAREAMLNRKDEMELDRELPQDDRIFRVFNRINMDYDDHDLDIDSLIGESGAGARDFYRKWGQHFSVSPKKYMMELRFRKACEELRSSDSSIAEIADACGFGNDIYFIRMFRQKFGMTPGQYRRAGEKRT